MVFILSYFVPIFLLLCKWQTRSLGYETLRSYSPLTNFSNYEGKFKDKTLQILSILMSSGENSQIRFQNLYLSILVCGVFICYVSLKLVCLFVCLFPLFSSTF